MNILFDGNFLFYKSFSIWSTYYQDRKKTPEENEAILVDALRDKEKQQVLLRKIIIDMCFAVNRFEDVKKVAFVIDSTSWRYKFHNDYKYATTRVRGAYYKDFLYMLNEFEKLLRKKGLIVSRVMGAEGDDLLYIWSIYFSDVLEEELVIVTGDSDIRQIVNPNISLFNNSSKNLRFHCITDKEVFWNEYFETDVFVEPTESFEVLLYKVIMGDTSDNIIKIKKGFGNVAFKKFIDSLGSYKIPKDISLLEMSQWIATRFCNFTKMDYKEVLGQVLFNLKMTWLNISVYSDMDYQSENGKSLLINMLDDVNKQKNTYSYKGKYTLEDFYGLTIK